MESIVLFASFFILLIMMVPIGYAIGIATLIAILVCGDGSVPPDGGPVLYARR